MKLWEIVWFAFSSLSSLSMHCRQLAVQMVFDPSYLQLYHRQLPNHTFFSMLDLATSPTEVTLSLIKTFGCGNGFHYENGIGLN